MLVLMTIIAGMAVALAVYHLLSGVFSHDPQLKIETVEKLGVFTSVLVFALCGPVLVLKLWFVGDGSSNTNNAQKDSSGLGALLISTVVALVWSGVIGIAATQSAVVAFAPLAARLQAVAI